MANRKASSPEEIRQFRKRLELTQEEMAQRLGVSFTSVNRWENGQSKPSKLAQRQILALFEEAETQVMGEN